MKISMFIILFATFTFSSMGADIQPDMPFASDKLVNNSRLSDAELRSYFENMEESKAALILDLDKDGLADFTGIEVWEFIARMQLILSDRKPFVYRRDAQGNTIDPNHQDVPPNII